MKLRKHDLCPIHRSRSCCERRNTAAVAVGSFGIRRIEDPRHPRGYREYRSPAEMRRLLKQKIAQQQRRCAICGREFKRI